MTWCATNQYIFVTKDWRTSYEPYITAQLRGLGVSAAWIRHEKQHNLASADLLFVAARDLRKIIAYAEATSDPVYFECRLGVSAKLITVPTPMRKPKRAKP